MKRKNTFTIKSFSFELDIVNVCQRISDARREYVLSKQLLRSGTAVGALIREAQNAESKVDFIDKLAVAQKECDETIYWLELMKEADYLETGEFEKLNGEAIELLKMLRSSILTTKQKINQSQIVTYNL